MTGFFRAEAVRHRQQGVVGGVRLVRPLPWSVLTVVVGVALAVGSWLSIGSYTRKVRLSGIVVSDTGGRCQAELYATSPEVGLLRAGQAVRLTFPALPAGTTSTVSGTLLAVSRRPLLAADLPNLPVGIVERAAREPLHRVLDEATSALDVEREREVNRSIRGLSLTRVIVAHRPETIASADRVVILQAGRVAQDFRSVPTPAATPRSDAGAA